MPPTTEEFEKLIDLGRLLQALFEDGPPGRPAADEFLALLPGLRRVFGPAFAPAAHEALDAIETAIRAGRDTPAETARHAEALSTALGMAFPVVASGGAGRS